MHQALINLGSLHDAPDEALESVVDQLIAESEIQGYAWYIEERISRTEALAILSHEFRRRSKST